MSKEFHWYEDQYAMPFILPKGHNEALGFYMTAKLIASQAEYIHTDQSAFFSTQRIAEGYRLFAHFASGVTTEVKLGSNESTDREIQPAYNLEKLLLNEEFGALSSQIWR